ALEQDMTIIQGDFNAKIDKCAVETCVGFHGLGEHNERGEGMIESCQNKKLVVTNIWFKLPECRLYMVTAPHVSGTPSEFRRKGRGSPRPGGPLELQLFKHFTRNIPPPPQTTQPAKKFLGPRLRIRLRTQPTPLQSRINPPGARSSEQGKRRRRSALSLPSSTPPA
ncbi:hypothetical protein ILUMI_04026, partial [Ignelater luminosus]